MNKPTNEIAREMCREKGMVCLVPREGVCGISSHEKTLCDCEVEELITAALDRERARCEKMRVALEKIGYQENPHLELTDDRNNRILLARAALADEDGV